MLDSLPEPLAPDTIFLCNAFFEFCRPQVARRAVPPAIRIISSDTYTMHKIGFSARSRTELGIRVTDLLARRA